MTTIELDKEQSKKADLLLKSLCDSDATFDREEADKIFLSESESDFVCSILEKRGLIDIISKTENDLLYRFTKTDVTCGFLKNGGLTKEYKKSKKLDWYKIIPIILSVIFGGLTLYFANLNYHLKQKQHQTDNRVYDLSNENKSLKKNVDSLNVEVRTLIKILSEETDNQESGLEVKKVESE